MPPTEATHDALFRLRADGGRCRCRFGRGFSANTDAILNGTNVTVNGKRRQLDVGELAQGGFGNGVAQSADMVSKYLIERAEQYQPVIEMPTGINVEIVFLEGVFIQN